MCLAIPGKVINIIGRQIEVEYPHEKRTVLLGIDDVKKGDYVMVQMGIAMKKLTKLEALDILSAWGEL